MSSDINRFNDSMEKWTGLKCDGKLGAPRELGVTAIMFNQVSPEHADFTTLYHESEAWDWNRGCEQSLVGA